MKECTFIDNYLKPISKDIPSALGLQDDAAIISLREGEDFVISKDMLVEGVHFLDYSPPSYLAQKIVRVNISDIAAMGARPYAMLLGGTLHPSMDESWMEAFFKSLHYELQKFGCALIGGDTVSSVSEKVFSVTVLGTVPKGKALLRSHAKDGDDIWVTGYIGDAWFGLKQLLARSKPLQEGEELLGAALHYYAPDIKVDFAYAVREFVHAAIDISDGLVIDMERICKVSSCGATIEVTKVPLSLEVQNALENKDVSYEDIITGGDDYQLIITAPTYNRDAIISLSGEQHVNVTRIGTITKDPQIYWCNNGEALTLSRRGYEHQQGA